MSTRVYIYASISCEPDLSSPAFGNSHPPVASTTPELGLGLGFLPPPGKRNGAEAAPCGRRKGEGGREGGQASCCFTKEEMTGKAKPKKHTAKEIAAKVDAATTNRGGGKAGQSDRLGQDKGGHAKLECPHCKITAPDLKSMQIHHEARHPKVPFDETKLNDLHAVKVPDSAKPKPGIRGSFKKLQPDR